jgi:predicted transcriptional regulator
LTSPISGFSDIPPKLSFHLNTLKDCGIVTQDEKRIYYLTEYGEALIELSETFEKKWW